jgi:phenylacetate-CoA ligase
VSTTPSRTSSTQKPRPRSIAYPYLGAAAAGAAGLIVERFGSARVLRHYQTSRLRALLHHAYETVPFYRLRFDQAGFHPNQFRTLDDLQRVPLTRKADIRLATDEEAVANDCDPSHLHRHTTGGSTGEPTKLRFTPYEDRLLRMFRLLATMRLGLRLRDRRTQLRTDQPFSSKIEEHFVLPSQILYAFLPPEDMRANLCQFRPDVIRGFPSALASFADQITDEDRLHLRPRFLTTDSETLTDLARERIEKAFKAPVFDIYDCYECNVIAYQCTRSEGYHVMDPAVVVEVLNEDGPVEPGETGEVALTSLHAWAAPLIRYMPGDMVERGPNQCACGAPTSTLAKVYGRTHDLFLLPNGRSLHPKYLAAPIRIIMPVLRQYQIAQEAIDRVVVKLQGVTGAEMPPEKLETIRKGMLRILGEGVTVLINVVDDIPSEPNGKFRPYRSYVVQGAGVQCPQ